MKARNAMKLQYNQRSNLFPPALFIQTRLMSTTSTSPNNKSSKTTTTSSSSSSSSSWKQRLSETKGYVEYNPNESFVIHVQWVVTNLKVGREMIEALQKCAMATSRDAPPVLCYLFRISHDQRLAKQLIKDVTTIGQHPQYSKKYKIAKYMPNYENIIAACQREGLSALPFEESWPIDTPMTKERAQVLDFDPIVIDLTEIYLDNRSFSNHAARKDYLNAYSVLMQPYRSLQVYTKVAGRPTQGIWDRVLEPMLKAKRCSDPERLVLCKDKWKGEGVVEQYDYYVLLDLTCDTLEIAEKIVESSLSLDSSVGVVPYYCIFQIPSFHVDNKNDNDEDTTPADNGYKLIMPIMIPNKDDSSSLSKTNLLADGGGDGDVNGRVILYSTNDNSSIYGDNDDACALTKKKEDIDMIYSDLQKSSLLGQQQDDNNISIICAAYVDDDDHHDYEDAFVKKNLAGFGLSAKLRELVEDSAVECSDYP